MSLEMLTNGDLTAHRHLVVSERLRGRRRDLGLTQKEVVSRLRRMGVGTTNKALSSLEHGAGLDVAKLPELARALECTLTYLVGLTTEPGRWEPDRPWRPDGSGPHPRPTAARPGPRASPRVPTAPVPRPGILGPLVPGWTDDASP